MIAEDDPEGHYHALGLAPNATQAQISHAYREWAKAVHPDVSGQADAHDFLRVKQAYDTLNDAARRARYDAASHHSASRGQVSDASASPAEGASATHGASADHWAPAEPYQASVSATRCSVCNAISVQPRYCIFYRVVSAVVYYRVDHPQGVYCPRCAAKTSLRASAISWLCGWWGIIGIFQTPVALWRNFRLGDKPRQVNARLLITQAHYFVSTRDFALARACLQQAVQFADGEDAENLLSLGHSLGDAGAQKLRNEWASHRHLGSFGQASPWLLLAGGVLFYSVSLSLKAGVANPGVVASSMRAPASATPPAVRLPGSKDIRHVATDTATIWITENGKSVTGGYLPQFTTVEVVRLSSNPDFVVAALPDGQSATLAAAALAAGNGKAAKAQWCQDLVQEPPHNGEVLRKLRSGPNRAVVTNSDGDAAMLKFRDAAGAVDVALFLNGRSQSLIEDFPDGSYHLEFATGRRWNRKCGFFEQAMSTQRFPALEVFASWEEVEIRQGRHVTVVHTRAANYVIPLPPDAIVQAEPLDQDAFVRN